MTPPSPPAFDTRAWPHRTQCALAAVLVLALGLVSWAAYHAHCRQPLELQKAGTWKRVDLNEADIEQLRVLPGLNDTLARRIVAYRESRGRFQSVDELERIHGIGPTILARVRSYLQVAPAPTKDAEIVTVALRTSQEEPPRKSRKELPTEPLDLNTASLEQLQNLPGIGRALAQRIVDARAQAPFRTVEDLLRVKGIGETTLKNVRPYVKVGARGI